MKANSTKKRRQWIKPVSDRRRRESSIYSKIKLVWLPKNARCLACNLRKTDDVHHMRGRLRSLLIDLRFWLPVCRSCHDWIQANPRMARELGWLAELGKWKVEPKDAQTNRLRDVLDEHLSWEDALRDPV